MSVWRIDKVDAQTRALAEAAAKAAGLPLGVWLERAIMRRAENRAASAQPPIIPAVVAEPLAAPEPDLSPEMKSALAAAERRRHRRNEKTRTGDSAAAAAPEAEPAVAAELADPFAAPEPDSHDLLFERPLETASAAEAGDPIPRLEEDLPLPIADDSQAIDPLFAGAEIVQAQPVEIAPAAEAATEMPPIVAPTWQDANEVTTTSRQSVLPPQTAPAPRRVFSSLPFIALGMLVVIAASVGAYLFPSDSGSQRPPTLASQSTPPPAEPAKPVQQAAAPAPEPSVAAPSSPPPLQPDAAATSSAPTPAPTPASVPVQEQSQPAAPPPPLPRPTGPSLANLGLPDPAAQPAQAPLSQVDQTAPPAAAQPAPATQTDRPPLAGEALPALRNRAEAGDMDAQVELGRRYIEGIGVGRNAGEAGKWLLRAADQGNAQAQFNVGVMYERGVGLAVNLPKALEYYRKSAAQNTPMALHNLALFHANEQPGYKSDPAQARRLMTQAADLGLAESQYSLALMLLQGVGGPADRVQGLSWMLVAARPNMPQLIDAVRQLSTQFSEAERSGARQLAEGHVRRIQANLQRLRTGSTATPAAAAAQTTPATPRVIDRAAIMEMQKLMAGLKIYGGAADGTLGPRTAAAIKEFQAMAGMTVDGKPSVELLENLRDVAGLTSQ